MNNTARKLLSLLLCLVMMLSLFPAAALAEDGEEITVPEEEYGFDHEGESFDLPETEEDEDDYAGMVRVEFICDPADTVITVYSPQNLDENGEPLVMEPEEDGSYLLWPGEYLYNAECSGYEPVYKATFYVTESKQSLRLSIDFQAEDPTACNLLAYCNSDIETYSSDKCFYVSEDTPGVFMMGYEFLPFETEHREFLTYDAVKQIAFYSGALYYSVSNPCEIKRIDLASMDVKTVVSTDADISRFAIAGNQLFYLSNYTIFSINLKNGSPQELISKCKVQRFWLADETTLEYIAEDETLLYDYQISSGEETARKNTISALEQDTKAPTKNGTRGLTLSYLRDVKFPHGKYWNHVGGSNNPDGYTSSPCTCHKSGHDLYGGCDCNSFSNSIQCFGYALKVAYDYYGSNPRNWSKVYNLDSLKAGDYIRYKKDINNPENGHSIWVTAVDGDTITYTDCNSTGYCQIRWEGTISKSTVLSTLNWVWVAPYEATGDTTAGVSLEPGIYTIHSARDWNKVLDIASNSTESGANIQLFDFLDDDVQKFRVIQDGDYYYIQSVYSGMWLDVASPVTESRSNVQLFYTNENPEEKWSFEDAGNGYVYIKNYYGNYVDIAGDTTDNYENIQVYSNKESDSQRWRFIPVAEPVSITPGVYTIHSAWDWNKTIDIQSNSTESGANIQLYDYLPEENVQKFRVIQDGDFYYIQSVYSEMWLDVAWPLTESHSNVQLFYTNENPEEKWQFENAGNGYVYIRNYYGNYLDIASDSLENHANIQVYHAKEGNSQRWRLVAEPEPITVQEGIYTIHSARDDNMVLDIAGDSMEEHANIQLYHFLDNTVQQFRVVKSGENYRIQSVYSGYWLDVASPSTESHSNVQLFSVNTNPEEQWQFEDAGNGYVYIRNYYGNYIDLAGDGTEDYTNIQVFHAKEGNSQRWRLTPISYQININANGGTASTASLSVRYKETCNLSSSFVSREGYSLKGWNLYRPADQKWFVPSVGWCTEAEITANGYSKLTYIPNLSMELDSTWLNKTDVIVIDTFTFYAVWEESTYTISYNANGGTGAPAAQTKTHDVALTLSTTKPTRSNASAGSYTVTLNANGGSVSPTSLTAARTTSYSFKNWNTAQNGSGTSYAPGASFTTNADTTLYAQWNSSTSTAAVTLPTPTRTGYTFKGWATSSTASSGTTGSYTPTGNVTLYAIWDANKYTITFNDNGGTGGPGTQIKIHDVALPLSTTTPTRPDESAGSYTVTLNANGGNVSTTSLTAARTTSYTFKNWNTAQNGSGTSYVPGASFTTNADMTLYAQWNSSTSTAAVTLPTPSRTGYAFKGWATSNTATSGTTGSYTPSGNVTLYAIWEANKYTITFNDNGGTGGPGTQIKTHDVALNLSTTQPTRSNASAGSYTVTLNANGGNVSPTSLTAARTTSYSFKNWNMAQNGSGASYAPGASFTTNADTTLYAQWNSSTSTAAVTLPTPTRTGYTFKGWADSASAASGTTGSYTPTSNVTLYAIWEQNAPETDAKLIVDGGRAQIGKEIRVPVRIEKNPGVVSIEISVVYDETVLEWTGVMAGEFGGTFDAAVGSTLTWFAEDPAVNETKDGVFATLTFRAKEDAEAGTTQISVTYDENNIYNADEENQPFQVVPGEIEIMTHTPGDINGDGEVNNKDVIRLRRYLKSHDIEVVEAALDVNGDGSVGNKDVTRLMRYLKYGDVDIF